MGVFLQGLASSTSCTSESTPGTQYGALCYDVGGCCPTAEAADQSSLKGDNAKA